MTLLGYSMDIDYVVAPALLLLAALGIAWLSIRHLRSLSARVPRLWLRIVDRTILMLLVIGSTALAACACLNAISLFRFRALHSPPGQIYLVNGRRMHINCSGTGSPTLVLDAGLGNDALIWGGVQPILAKTTRVCSYDRAGFGASDPVPGPRDADHIATELHSLLREANIPGPIVLMGHSISGIYIREYAQRYPEEIAGLVFVDGSTPLQDQNPALKAAGAKGLPEWAAMLVMRSAAIAGVPRLGGACSRAMPGFDPQAGHMLAEDMCHPQFGAIEGELESFTASGEETVHSGPFGSLPVLIFSQDPAKTLASQRQPRQTVDMVNAWNQMQEDLKKLSTRSRRIIAKGSTHYVQVDRADLVEKEVPNFIEQIRGSAAEPSNYGTTITE